MVKPLSEQLSDLSLHAKKAEDDLAAAKKETHDKVVARRDDPIGVRGPQRREDRRDTRTDRRTDRRERLY